MSGISIIENAVLKPTKREVAEQWLGYFEHIGSYRFVDPDGQVGIESLIGFDLDRRLVQMPVTYRSAEFDAEHTLTTMDHSVLGTRYVSNAMGDPVAVREYIRVILEADNGAQRSDGKVSVLDVRGSGNREEKLTLGEVRILEATRQRAVGYVRIDGTLRGFVLRVPHLLVPENFPRLGHNISPMRLNGSVVMSPKTVLIAAELSWHDI